MKMRHLLLALFLFLGSGCSPTYPKATLAESLKKLCKDEYGVDVSVQMAGKTLGVQVPLEKLFDSSLKLSPEVGEKLDGVMLATSRVVLSTDNPPDFYVIVAQDKRVPGVELKLTRYVQDLRRLNYHDLSRGEFTKRMIFEFGLDLGIFQEETETFRLEEVKLEQFLAQQMAHRIKTRFDEEAFLKEDVELKLIIGQFIPYPAFGRTQEEKRFGRFILTLNMQKRGLRLWGERDWEDEKRVLSETLDVILEVLRGYRFEDYDRVEVKAPFLSRTFAMDREVLELYRTKKIALSELLLTNDFNLSPYDAELLLKK